MNVIDTSIAAITENDLRLLRIFRVIAECGGLTAAEIPLKMERSTISRHLQALEVKLGGPLCIRGPSGFEITDLGRVALRAAITACDTLDHVREQLNHARTIIPGDLMVGISDNCLTNPASRVVEAISRFHAQAPSVRLHLSIRPPVEIFSELEKRQLHLAIASLYPGHDKLEGRPLFREDFRLYIGGTSAPRLHIDDLNRHGYVMVTRDSHRQSLEFASQMRIERRVVARGLEAAATLLATGGHVGFLPTHLVSALTQFYQFQEVQGAESFRYVREFSLVRETARPLSRAGELLAELISDIHQGMAR